MLRKWAVAAMAMAVSSVFLSLVPHNALAADYTYSGRPYKYTHESGAVYTIFNKGERYAVDEICQPAQNCGAMWVSNRHKAYKDDSIDEVYGNTAYLQLRGSVALGLNQTYTGRNVYATRLKMQHHKWHGPATGYLDVPVHLRQNYLNRGSTTPTKLEFGHGGDKIDFAIDVSKLPFDQSVEVTLIVDRCYGNSPNAIDGTCDDQHVKFNVIRREKQPPKWNITPTTNIQKEEGINPRGYVEAGSATITAHPGDKVRWRHKLYNNGPHDANRKIQFSLEQSYTDQGVQHSWSRFVGLADAPEKRRHMSLVDRARGIQNGDRYIIRDSDVGKRICQRIGVTPVAWNNGGSAWANPACVEVVSRPDFNLVPNVRADDTFIAPGAKEVKKVSFSVANTSTKHKSGPAAYAFVWFVVRRGEPVPTSSTEFTVPKKPGTGNAVDNWHCHEFTKGHPGRKCEPFERNPAGHAFGVNESKRRDQEPHDVAGLGLTPGDSICYASIVNKYQHRKTSFDYRSAVTCVKVAKKPSVQVWGADVRAGVKSSGRGNVVTGRVVSDGRLYGSWAEYGIMARRSVYSSSGAQLAPVGGAPSGGGERTLNPLTFRNTLQPFGNFGVIAASPRHPLGSMPAAGPAKQVTVDGALTSQNHHTLTLTGGTLPKAKRVVLRADTVRITGDVLYTDETIHSAAELPQLVIRARHIIVAEKVRRIDAWLVADGAVSTCGDVADPAQWHKMNVPACDVPLQINGPVHAKQVYLRRTHGATLADPGSPAEIINARPDVYMAEYGRVAGSGAIQTMHIQELPPRL